MERPTQMLRAKKRHRSACLLNCISETSRISLALYYETRRSVTAQLFAQAEFSHIKLLRGVILRSVTKARDESLKPSQGSSSDDYLSRYWLVTPLPQLRTPAIMFSCISNSSRVSDRTSLPGDPKLAQLLRFCPPLSPIYQPTCPMHGSTVHCRDPLAKRTRKQIP